MSTLKERVVEAVIAAKDRGHDVTTISKKCGISVQAVYAWTDPLEKLTRLRSGSILGLAELSGMSPWYIHNGTGKKTSSQENNSQNGSSKTTIESAVAEYQIDPTIADLAALEPDDAAMWKSRIDEAQATLNRIKKEIRAAANKARQAAQEESDREQLKARDPPPEARRASR